MDIFKKENINNEKNTVIKENKTEIKGSNETNKYEFENGYILTQTRCSELLERIFSDKDNGEGLMKEVELSENIFILGYIERVIIPECQEKKDEKKLVWLKSIMTMYRKIFCDKLMEQDKFYKIISNTTGFPFMDKGCEHILVCDKYKDKIIKNLKDIYYDVEIKLINKEEFKEDLNELHRIGYRGMCFSDGVQKPYYFSTEALSALYKIEREKALFNPVTQYSMISLVQEMRRNINYDGCEETRKNLEESLVQSIITTRFIIPIKRLEKNQAELPVYKLGEDTEKPGIYVFTDATELEAFGKEGFINLEDGWEGFIYDFYHLIDLLKQASIYEICINYSGINFKTNIDVFSQIKKTADKLREEIKDKQEKWETEELPRILKDKEVPLIRDSSSMPIFGREKNSIYMSKYIFDILSRRKLKKEIMEFFINDSEMESISLYDPDFRRITLKVKEGKKSGLMIMPMRYEDEDVNESIVDNIMHYTENAARIALESHGSKLDITNEKKMNFYTISNKESENVYLPVFSDENEAVRIYPRDHYRYCTVSFDDILDNVKDYDGIVVNPATMSFIIENDLLESIYDLENK